MEDLPHFPENLPTKQLDQKPNKVPQDLNSLPSKSGWLQKLSTGALKRWQWRYCTMQAHHFSYYHSAETSQAACTLDFNQVSISLSMDPSGSEFVLVPAGGEREFRFRSPDVSEVVAWGLVLLEHIDTAKGSSALGLIPSISKFWRFPIISNIEFMNKAQTGDLLLFTSKSYLSKIQRGFTWSNYDHVALLVKQDSGHVCLFETTSQDGVNLLKWERFLMHEWQNLYKRLVYRPLIIDRNPEFLDKIFSFICDNKGKKYKLSTSKLLFRRKQSEGTDKEFFCSELVARVLQFAGVLPKQKAPWKYMPGHFSYEKEIKLVKGKLGKMECIEFYT